MIWVKIVFLIVTGTLLIVTSKVGKDAVIHLTTHLSSGMECPDALC